MDVELIDQVNEAGEVKVMDHDGNSTVWIKVTDSHQRDWWEDKENPDLRVSDIYTLAYLVEQGGGSLTKFGGASNG